MGGSNFGMDSSNMIGGHLPTDLLHHICQHIMKKNYTKSVFFNPEFESGFRNFNKYLRNYVETHSENDSKKASDRDRSRSGS
jgi:hypothetical protein